MGFSGAKRRLRFAGIGVRGKGQRPFPLRPLGKREAFRSLAGRRRQTLPFRVNGEDGETGGCCRSTELESAALKRS